MYIRISGQHKTKFIFYRFQNTLPNSIFWCKKSTHEIVLFTVSFSMWKASKLMALPLKWRTNAICMHTDPPFPLYLMVYSCVRQTWCYSLFVYFERCVFFCYMLMFSLFCYIFHMLFHNKFKWQTDRILSCRRSVFKDTPNTLQSTVSKFGSKFSLRVVKSTEMFRLLNTWNSVVPIFFLLHFFILPTARHSVLIEIKVRLVCFRLKTPLLHFGLGCFFVAQSWYW